MRVRKSGMLLCILIEDTLPAQGHKFLNSAEAWPKEITPLAESESMKI